MISILIPTYNYKIDLLINSLTNQIKKLGVNCEIICWDDASTQSEIAEVNKKICSLHHVLYIESKQNKGRTLTRQLLAEKAQYNWLLFLDADVNPFSASFLKNYLELIELNYDCIYGGICYEKEKPIKDKYLRWKNGRKREQVSASKRMLNPYKVIASSNLLVKKEVFISINKQLDKNKYGYDTIFAAKLKKECKIVFHIDNPVVHLGLEHNKTYLTKKEQAVETLFQLYQKGTFSKEHENSLLKAFLFLKKFRLVKLFYYTINFNKKWIKKNILGNYPSLFLLDLYCLAHFCKHTLNKHA